MTRQRQALIDEHLNMVYSLAIKIYRSLHGVIELDDLISFGTVGLLQAADRYDPERGTRFSTFAYPRIRGAIYDGVRDCAPLPTTLFRQLRSSSEARQSNRLAAFVVSLDCHIENGHQVAAGCEHARDEALRHELNDVVEAAVAKLPKRERSLVRAHYYHDKTLKHAGSELGISKSWACRLHAHALDRLRSSASVMEMAA